MEKKGFTLIELLAVIVILAIIALIATPMILNVVEKSRKGAAESSALGYIDAVEKQIILNEVDDSKESITPGTYTVAQLKALGVKVKGKEPTGTLTIGSKNSVESASLSLNGYSINCTSSKCNASKGKYTSYAVGDSVTIDGIGYHVVKSSSASDQYVTLLRDESIGDMLFDENGGVDYETSTLKTYLNSTYKDTFGDKKQYLQEVTLLELGTYTKVDGKIVFHNIEGTYGYLFNQRFDWLLGNQFYSKTTLEHDGTLHSPTHPSIIILPIISSYEYIDEGMTISGAYFYNYSNSYDIQNGYFLEIVAAEDKASNKGSYGDAQYKFAVRPVITIDKAAIN